MDTRLAAICREGVRPEGADLLFTAADLIRAWASPAPLQESDAERIRFH